MYIYTGYIYITVQLAFRLYDLLLFKPIILLTMDRRSERFLDLLPQWWCPSKVRPPHRYGVTREVSTCSSNPSTPGTLFDQYGRLTLSPPSKNSNRWISQRWADLEKTGRTLDLKSLSWRWKYWWRSLSGGSNWEKLSIQASTPGLNNSKTPQNIILSIRHWSSRCHGSSIRQTD